MADLAVELEKFRMGADGLLEKILGQHLARCFSVKVRASVSDHQVLGNRVVKSPEINLDHADAHVLAKYNAP